MLLMIKMNMSRTISILISANKNVSSKKQNLLSLSSSKKEAITIPKISSFESSIFWIPTIVARTQRPSFFAKSKLIALTFLPKLIKAWIDSYCTHIEYCIQRTHYSSDLDSGLKTGLRGLECSILGLVIYVEVTKTDTSFMVTYWDIVILFMTTIILHLAEVLLSLFVLFNNSRINSYH